MPVSKEPRAKKTGKAPPRSGAATPTLPDRRVMERFLTAIGGRGSDDPTEKAQDVMYEAWEQTTANRSQVGTRSRCSVVMAAAGPPSTPFADINTARRGWRPCGRHDDEGAPSNRLNLPAVCCSSRSRIALARKALSISPLCADAYVLLAEENARNLEEAQDLYAKGIEAGELALGPEGFAEYEGAFWGFLETRPYMRARLGLALTLLKLGDENGAISHFRDMLRLNPNDNQGVRYLLAGCLLRRGEDAALKELLASYEDEGSAFWLYTRALLAFRAGGEDDEWAAKLAQEAWAANEHVPAILAGTKPPVPSKEGYITMGGPDEATDYVTECGPAWHNTPGAIAWLTKAAAILPPKRRTRPATH